MQNEALAQLSQRFKEHGENIYRSVSQQNSSPLYAYLSLEIANDPDLLAFYNNLQGFAESVLPQL